MTLEDRMEQKISRKQGLHGVDGIKRKLKVMQEGKHRGPYFWIWGVKDGRLVVVGCKTTEQEAQQFGYEKMGDIDFKVEELPTRDMDSAVRMIKGKLLGMTANLDLSIRRARRKL